MIKKTTLGPTAILLLIMLLGVVPVGTAQPDTSWAAGTARAVITPEEPLWMQGFAFRDHPAREKVHDLWVKALALEDADGRRAVLITSDLSGVSKTFADTVRNRIHRQTGLSRSQIILNNSHTHSGPLLERDAYTTFNVPESQIEPIARYTRWLKGTMVKTAVEALESMRPVTVQSGKGVTRFAVNRRNNERSTLDRRTEISGPMNYDVPVLKVASPSGTVRAIVFGYACHPTTTSVYQWNGDYPGYAQLELEERYPDATALFVAGASGDQAPWPKGTLDLARQYGEQLAATVDRVLHEDMKTLDANLATGYTEVTLELSELPIEAELKKSIQTHSGYQERWARHLLKRIQAGEDIRTSYPYPVQMWQLGDQTVAALGGELLVDYAVNIKRLMGQDTFVFGYSNGVMAYIPSVRVLREGGYEGNFSQKAHQMPTTWAPTIEQTIMGAVIEVADQLDIAIQESPLVD